MDWSRMREEIADLGERFATLLREAPTADQPVTDSDWTIGELGAHMVEVARRYVAIGSGAESMPFPDTGGSHAGMAGMNAARLAEFDERDPEKLAALLLDANENVLGAFGADPERSVFWYDIDVPLQSAAGLWLDELLIHGYDLARTLDRAWPISREEALAIFDALVPIFPRLVDRAVAEKAAGTYHLRLRGGDDYTFDVEANGDLTIDSRKPGRADLHISASPVAYLLVGTGRANQWAAVAKGQIRAWGRKPWLAARFGTLFNAP